MKKIALGSLLVFLFATAALYAQSFNLQSGREPVASLDGLWRFHTGDNPQWSSPSFDDSQWPLIRSDESWTKQGHPHYSGYAWYRFTIQAPDGSKPLALLLPMIFTGYEVFANGKLVGGESSTGPVRNPFAFAPPHVFRLPSGAAGPQTIQIAIRVWDDRRSLTYLGGGPQEPGSAAGDPVVLLQHLHLQREAEALTEAGDYAYCLLTTLVGITILVLFLFRREDREYLWFSILLLMEAASTVMNLIFRLSSIPYATYISLAWAASCASAIAALAFFSIVLGVRRTSLWWVVCVAAAVSPLSAALLYFRWAGLGASFAINLCFLLPAFVWVAVTLVIRALRKDVSARLVLAPAMLFYGFGIVFDVVQISWIFGWQRKLRMFNLALVRHPFPLNLEDAIDYLFILALLIFLVRRFSLARREEERLAAEFEAAKTVQSLLIPAIAPDTPGFTVESVYLPASEVGGDFFQVLPAEDGSLLIVVGDVSGKGLKAAMTVSAIIGALRGCMSRKPSEVLAHLNQVLHGQITGFVTCGAALIDREGKITLANAGNPAPYLNGEELPVDSGLPLGIVAESDYSETTYHLEPGDRLTFVSDGVVEATNEDKELFGFDRTQAISAQSADIIAAAARQFGQQDDISVLAVTRVPVLKAAFA